MHYVYVIKSVNRNYIYVGISDDIERRFSEYQNGKNKTTKPYAPFIIIHSEAFETRTEARKREIYLKSGIGKEYIKTLI
jgi:putative endonuclease